MLVPQYATKQLSAFLFRHPAPDGQPLFETIIQISCLLVQLDEYSGNKQHSIRAALSVIINSRRPCPPNLQKALQKLIGQRLEKSPLSVREEWQARFIKLFATKQQAWLSGSNHIFTPRELELLAQLDKPITAYQLIEISEQLEEALAPTWMSLDTREAMFIDCARSILE